jgi:hypothetical protein
MDVLHEHILMVLHERKTEDVLRKCKNKAASSGDDEVVHRCVDEVWKELDLATMMCRQGIVVVVKQHMPWDG